MDRNMLMEAGWPSHWACYEGRCIDDILADVSPLEKRLLWDEATKAEQEEFVRLSAELHAHPYEIDKWIKTNMELARFRKDLMIRHARFRADLAVRIASDLELAEEPRYILRHKNKSYASRPYLSGIKRGLCERVSEAKIHHTANSAIHDMQDYYWFWGSKHKPVEHIEAVCLLPSGELGRVLADHELVALRDKEWEDYERMIDAESGDEPNNG